MTRATVEPWRWPPGRWWVAVALALGLQVGLVFLLGARSPGQARRPAAGQQIYLVPDATVEFPAWSDPTLFALANRHGFSGAAWLNVPPLETHPVDWTEPPAWLPLQARHLSHAFDHLVKTNAAAPFLFEVKPEPHLLASQPFLPLTVRPAQSTLQIEGDLARRPLVVPLALPVQTNSDMLTASVVQAIVNPEGYTLSAKLLSGSGLKQADRQALELTRSARFQSLLESGPERSPAVAAPLSLGKLIFNWHTVPLPVTNSPPANP